MTKKFFRQFYFDLILIKYYKKRLKSQLKNKKLYINKKTKLKLLYHYYQFIFLYFQIKSQLKNFHP